MGWELKGNSLTVEGQCAEDLRGRAFIVDIILMKVQR